jgi:hypothetical protein
MTRMSPEEADEYRRAVLDALGADDPIVVQEAEPELWRRLIEGAGAHLRTCPDDGGWSALECLGHMADSELVTSARYRWVLAEPEPTLVGFDQSAWVARLDHSGADPASLLDLFGALRRANVALWRRTPVADRARVGLHAERGPESFELLFRLQAGHGRLHRAQAERALAQIRRPRPVG